MLLNGWLKNTTDMETKFNFKSSVCTSKEQSERLLSLGLKKETADMQYHAPHPMPYPIGHRCVGFPAWSLHRLWELDRIHDITLDSDDEIATLYDEVINNIEAQIKEGFFSKEYLEE